MRAFLAVNGLIRMLVCLAIGAAFSSFAYGMGGKLGAHLNAAYGVPAELQVTAQMAVTGIAVWLSFMLIGWAIGCTLRQIRDPDCIGYIPGISPETTAGIEVEEISGADQKVALLTAELKKVDEDSIAAIALKRQLMKVLSERDTVSAS